VATGLASPTGIVNAHDGSNRLFVVEQPGRIRVIRNGVLLPQPYIDMTASVTVGSTEYGLDGLVFAPTFRTTGRLYVYYTAPGDYDVLERLTVSDPTTDTPTITQRTVLIKQKKSTPWHHGGGMVFDSHGLLYIGIGDGGPMGDPFNHAQNHGIILGKILRIDPGDHPGQAPYQGTYTIPKSNPFYYKKGYRKEIWALGLRNPFRLSFDDATGDLWIADVGQDTYEEVDFQAAGSRGGQNYGWHVWEGNHLYKKTPTSKPKPVSKKGYTFPILEYKHPYGECVIGGYVYRGTSSPALYGTYLYGDWVRGWIGAIRRTSATGALLKTPQRAKLAQTDAWISTWGEDEAGEPYFADYVHGIVYHVSATTR
jgi:glucose/arabinose dehydrogenase